MGTVLALHQHALRPTLRQKWPIQPLLDKFGPAHFIQVPERLGHGLRQHTDAEPGILRRIDVKDASVVIFGANVALVQGSLLS